MMYAEQQELRTATAPPAATASGTPPPYRLHFRNAPGLTTMRWLVAAGVLCLLSFLWWFASTLRIGYAPLFGLLALSLGFKLLRMGHEWLHYVQVREPIPPDYTPAQRRVDVLTTACPGEPHAMIIRTLEAMQAIQYPHTSYLCDEGDDPVLRAACTRLGVVHVTRVEKVHAKAGNINNALRQATGEMCVVLDPDHVLAPDFLDQVLPYFEDDRVGFVQVVQAYGNQQESLVAQGAAEQTYHFYGPLMMSMNGYGTVQAIGANCTFRRAALDSIGGHAAGLTEDMHTAMRLHAAGWQSVYVPKVLSRGLVPASLAAFYSQQLKWARGAFDLLFRVYPKLFGRFTWAQRVHYLLLPLYFFSGVVALVDLSLPLLAIGLTQFPWLVALGPLALHALPLLGMSLLIRCYAQRWLREPGEGGLHLAGGILRIGSWWVYTLGFVYALVGVRVPYLPTPKESRCENEWRLALPNLVLAALLLAACKYGRMVAYGSYTNILIALALLNVAILLAASAMGQHQAVHNFIRDMASWPFRRFVLLLHRTQVAVAAALVPRLRRHSRALALTGLTAMGAFFYVRASSQARLPPQWLLAGASTLHFGHEIAGAHASRASRFLTGAGPARGAASDTVIAALSLPELGPTLPTLVARLAGGPQVPLLSWPVEAQAAQRAGYWQNLARQVKKAPGPVMLRPRLQAPTAAAYRRAWIRMVQAFRREKAVNAVWVWTPDAADTLLLKFPGATYTHWVAGPLQADNDAPDYATLRTRLMQNLAVHQVPVLLLAPAPTAHPRDIARRLAWEYPEIKALVFAAPVTTVLTMTGPPHPPTTPTTPPRPEAAGLNSLGHSEDRKRDGSRSGPRTGQKKPSRTVARVLLHQQKLILGVGLNHLPVNETPPATVRPAAPAAPAGFGPAD